jgi:C4-dicarboxylate-specific signal transduction histidine kinase
MLNLVMNAAEAMSEVPEDRRVLSIRGECAEYNGKPAILITVHDLGCGFSIDDPERLFEALYTTKSEGLGMGLRISRSIVEVHGGALWAEANPDAGATLFCLWPAAETESL